MSAPGESAVRDPATSASGASLPQLYFEDALASSRRLWVRGRLTRQKSGDTGNPRLWSFFFPFTSNRGPLPSLVHVATKINGQVLEADVPLQADGRFEALFTVNLPGTWRGWRIALQRVTGADWSAEASNLVLAPPVEAVEAVAVLLPFEFTFPPGGSQRLAGSESARGLARLLHGLEQGIGRSRPVYYLACAPRENGNRQAELSLAGSALGWPAGVFVLLPGAAAAPALAGGLDRLRWLLAGSLDLLVLNLEPTLASPLVTPGETDRASIVRFMDHSCWINGKADAGKTPRKNGETKDFARRTDSLLVKTQEADRTDGEPFHSLSPTAAPQGSSTSSILPARSNHRPLRSGLVPRHPVVFCHGLLAFSMLKIQMPEDRNCFTPLRGLLRERGLPALYPQVSPTSSIAERARELRGQILAWTDEPVNLIAHSMGGLDARYLISHLGMAGRVRSLTTISTPHRGTYLAAWFLENFHERVPLFLVLEKLGVQVGGFRDCRPEDCLAFNARTPDSPEVRYFSYGGEVPPCRLSPTLRRAWSLVTQAEGPNDGMVTVASARWGEYLGTLSADHFAQTPDAMFLRPGEDFDSIGFYARLVEDLARRGF